MNRIFFAVRNDFNPLIGFSKKSFDFFAGNIFLQLDRQSLRVAAHGSYANAQTVNGHASGLSDSGFAQNLVSFGTALPFFAALSVFDFFVDPGDQAAGKRYTESFVGEVGRTKFFGNFAVDGQNGKARRSEERRVGKECRL